MRRGQAAMEFLMTYGWAILMVILAIGTLTYFGVTSIGRLAPEKCSISNGFVCGEYRLSMYSAAVDGSEVLLRLKNNLGEDVTINQLNFTCKRGCTSPIMQGDSSCGLFSTGGLDNGPYVTSFTLNSGASVWVACNPAPLSSSILFKNRGATGKVEFTFDYTVSGQSVSHTVNGDIISNVEIR